MTNNLMEHHSDIRAAREDVRLGGAGIRRAVAHAKDVGMDVAVEDVRNAPASPATGSWPSTSSAVGLTPFSVFWWSGDQADKRRYLW